MKRDELQKDYLRAYEEFRNSEVKEDKSLLILSVLRLICFAGGLLLVVFLAVKGMGGLALSAALFFIILFLLLLRAFAQHSEKKEMAANLATINQNEALSVSGDNSKFRSGSRFV